MDPRCFNPSPSATDTPPPPIEQQQQHPGTKRPHPAAVKSRSASSYPRKRAVSACLVCRGRKTKCDNQRPQCGFCRQNGAECVYEAEKLATYGSLFLLRERRKRVTDLLLTCNFSSDSMLHPWRFWTGSQELRHCWIAPRVAIRRANLPPIHRLPLAGALCCRVGRRLLGRILLSPAELSKVRVKCPRYSRFA